jgi:hypothetical protein
MEKTLQMELAELGDEVRAAAIPEASKRTALWCVDKLAPLYAQFCLTYESRYGEEITRLVQGALNELNNKAAGPVGQVLATSMTQRLRLFHERSGIPTLNLKTPRPSPPPRSRKAN